VGDEVLVVTAQILQAHARPGDTVYRLGGEEFAVVLLSTDGELAMTIAERHRGAVERGKPAGLAVTISAGVASGDGPHATWDWLYQRADRALLEAKRSGRNRVLAAQELAPSARPSTPGLATAVPLSRLT
jgi:diguanylate cyclase (GGDEF)-like protein